MRKHIFFFLLSLASGFMLSAQKIDQTVSFRDINTDSYFRFNYDNDYFSATDENYTQGYNLELVLPIFRKNPLNFLFLKPENAQEKYGLAIEHIGFTPNDYGEKEIQYGDRPFAAAIMLKSFKVATDTLHQTRWVSALSMGMIGPAAFGGEMQKSIHEATGNTIPLGWRNQIKNDVVFNYELGFEKQLFNFRDLFSLQAQSNLKLGTLFTNFSVGTNASLGIIDDVFSSHRKRKFALFVFAQPKVTLVGYDASLEGGLFNRESVYTIPTKNVERLSAEWNLGLILKTKTLYFEYSRNGITKEFSTGNAANWGGIKIGFSF